MINYFSVPTMFWAQLQELKKQSWRRETIFTFMESSILTEEKKCENKQGD